MWFFHIHTWTDYYGNAFVELITQCVFNSCSFNYKSDYNFVMYIYLFRRSYSKYFNYGIKGGSRLVNAHCRAYSAIWLLPTRVFLIAERILSLGGWLLIIASSLHHHANACATNPTSPKTSPSCRQSASKWLWLIRLLNFPFYHKIRTYMSVCYFPQSKER